jgi:hypothetical protein
MQKGRAQQVQAIFISDNPQLVNGLDTSLMTSEELATWEALQDAVAALQASNPAAQVYILDMNRYRGTQIVQLERWAIPRYPAVRLWAQYADDSQAYYNFAPPIPGTTPDLDKVAPALQALYAGEFGNNSLLCKLFPPLCALSAWAWLAVTLYAAYEATQTKGPARAAWITGAVLAGNEFLQRGGLKTISLDKAPGLQTAQQPNSLTAR